MMEHPQERSTFEELGNFTEDPQTIQQKIGQVKKADVSIPAYP